MILRAFTVVGLLLLSSCLRMEQTVTLSADGSGKLTFGMTMREATIAEVRTAAAAAQLGATVDPTAVFDKATTETELTTAGLELVNYETKKTARERQVQLEAKFSSFEALQQNPLNGTQAEWVLAKGPKAGTARLTLYPQGRAAWLEARAKAEKLKTEVDPVVGAFFRKRQQQLAGLDLTLRIAVPGQVYLWTKNMKKTGEREVVARIRAQDIKTPEDLVRRLAPRFELIFDATGTELKLD